MTYLQFHLVFVLPPLALLLLATLARRNRGAPLAHPVGRAGASDALALAALVAHAAIALLYTTPWDNYLVFREVWGYPTGRVLATLGYVPLEEYLFFVLQTLLVGLWLLWLARLRPWPPAPARRGRGRAARRWGTAGWLGLGLLGAWLLTAPWGLYLGLILVWAAPVLALQWALGGDLLASRPGWLAAAIAPPSLYLMAADRYAIAAGIWWIRPDATTGVHLAGLPLEEGAFFLATNLLIGFGMTLALDPRARTRLDSLGRRARRLGRRLRARPAAAGVRWWHAVLLAWVLVMVPTPLAPRAFAGLAYLSTGLLALGVLGLALERMGRAALLACGLALLFGFGVEWLGSRSGLPFGAYRYTAPGPLLAGVPLLVPVGWWAFTALAVAVVPRRHRWWAAPLALVAWDLGLDPLMVRQGFWRFDHPGGYYGVPWSNFLGWAASGAVLVALLSVLVPRIERLSGRAARTVYGAQAGFMVIGLTLFGMPWAALAAFAAMGAVMLAWRPVRAAVQRAGSR